MALLDGCSQTSSASKLDCNIPKENCKEWFAYIRRQCHPHCNSTPSDEQQHAERSCCPDKDSDSSSSLLRLSMVKMEHLSTAIASAKKVNIDDDPSSIANLVKVTLHPAELWRRLRENTNEMIGSGRKLRPRLQVHISGLKPKSTYWVALHLQPVNNSCWTFSNGEWKTKGTAKTAPSSEQSLYMHPYSPMKGSNWSCQAISFQDVSLKYADHQMGNIRVHLKHKYIPRLLIFEGSPETWQCIEVPLPDAEFIVVNQYKNRMMSLLKSSHYPKNPETTRQKESCRQPSHSEVLSSPATSKSENRTPPSVTFLQNVGLPQLMPISPSPSAAQAEISFVKSSQIKTEIREEPEMQQSSFDVSNYSSPTSSVSGTENYRHIPTGSNLEYERLAHLFTPVSISPFSYDTSGSPNNQNQCVTAVKSEHLSPTRHSYVCPHQQVATEYPLPMTPKEPMDLKTYAQISDQHDEDTDEKDVSLPSQSMGQPPPLVPIPSEMLYPHFATYYHRHQQLPHTRADEQRYLYNQRFDPVYKPGTIQPPIQEVESRSCVVDSLLYPGPENTYIPKTVGMDHRQPVGYINPWKPTSAVKDLYGHPFQQRLPSAAHFQTGAAASNYSHSYSNFPPNYGSTHPMRYDAYGRYCNPLANWITQPSTYRSQYPSYGFATSEDTNSVLTNGYEHPPLQQTAGHYFKQEASLNLQHLPLSVDISNNFYVRLENSDLHGPTSSKELLSSSSSSSSPSANTIPHTCQMSQSKEQSIKRQEPESGKHDVQCKKSSKLEEVVHRLKNVTSTQSKTV